MEDLLTERQVQCLRLSATMTNKEIARELGISPHTVSIHIRNAMQKLCVNTRRAALRRIARNELCMPNVIPEPDVPPSDQSVLGPSDNDNQRHHDDPETLGFDMTILPAYLPLPPKHRGVRIGLMVSSAAIILVGMVAAIGLIGFVVDVVGRWAGSTL